ncbi:MAG: PHP domain-containing protein [Desulfotomaculum sp.]|nr:PHP domain-containing protein [Desulfotomaculum sp.]MCL0081072.1 PHP domain-containing protein [Peptococcaceae bacterium]
MAKIIVDLHCHTNVSDNSMSIKQVLTEAKKRGVTHLAITDHDTTLGIEKALAVGAKLGIAVIPGIEISAYDFEREQRLHILGYYVQPGHPAIKKLCDPLIAQRQAASRQMFEIIIKAGYKITWEQVSGYAGATGVFKQHISHALLVAGYCQNIFGSLYKQLFARGQQGQPNGLAYVPLEYVDASAAIEAILAAGGVPVLAHPAQFNSFPAVPGLVQAGLAGIEVKHPQHNQQAEAQALQLAGQFNLITTGGSDFHGFYNNHPFPLGSKNPGIAALRNLQQK